jgi:methyltransferase (TIGR00027 family)
MELITSTVTGTAFVVAEYRAEEKYALRPLYRDRIVEIFLSEDSRQAAARIASGSPLVKEMVKLRTRYFDDMLDEQIEGGCRQVVILGAGLDTRGVRKAAAGVTYFEIDDAGTLALKQACLADHGIRSGVRYIPGNYVTDGMMPLLLRNGFDPELATYVIWEGNTMYLDEASDRAILTQLREGIAHFRISFDYFPTSVVTRTTGLDAMTRMADDFARMRAPWITGFDDVHAFAGSLDLGVLDDVTTGELAGVYRPLSAPSAFGPFYSICTLGSR